MTNVSDEIPSSDLPVEFDISRELQLLRLRDNTLEDYVSDARHEWQSRMLRALDCGYEGLALEILHRDSKLSDWWQGGYLGSSLTKNGIKDLPRAAFSDVIEILMTISNEGNAGMLRNLIEGRIGHCLFERSEFLPLPLNHRVLSYMDEADRKSAYRPVIYALIHSDENGNAPTIHEYGRVLRRMRQYINTDEARWAVNDEYAEEVNYAGRATHEALPADRDWSVGATRNPKWMQFPHPRRYASNESSLKSIATFIKYFTHRIDTKIKHTAPNESLPWHLTYIGWTNKFERRQAEHYRHALGQDIKK
jgi:hypothetical protein